MSSPADTRPTVEEVVAKLQLQPHPEGGFFAETFRDSTVTLSLDQLPKENGFKVGRPISTAIFFLVPTSCVSRLHRIPSQVSVPYHKCTIITTLSLYTVIYFVPTSCVSRLHCIPSQVGVP